MALADKYTIKNLQADFPDDSACLEALFLARHTYDCSCGGVYKRYKPEANGTHRKQFQCTKCRFEIAPMAGTIFEKSSTPLTLWFHALLVFSNAKSGISAKELERQLGVTYKTAWRMLRLIREALADEDGDRLSGLVEMDETYEGGRARAGRGNVNQSAAMENKKTVIGAVERGGRIVAEVSPSARAKDIGGFLMRNVELNNTVLFTDESNRYNRVAAAYDRRTVNHRRKEYVRGDNHVNTLESFWGHVKRSIRGTHKSVSRQHLQSYLDGFVWLRNNRHSDSQRFASLLSTLLCARA
jgi:transposase-like protein